MPANAYPARSLAVMITAVAIAVYAAAFAAPAGAAASDQATTDNSKATQDNTAQKKGQNSQDRQKQAAAADPEVKKQQPDEVLASQLIGLQVKNGSDEDADEVGEIRDLVVNQNLEITDVVISGIGGFLGIGEKDIAVPPDKVHLQPEVNFAVIDLTEDELNDAPKYKSLQEQKEDQLSQQNKQNQKKQQDNSNTNQ
ncbi:MAG TPA: PRC-barrel domain-containing protein [Salinisphaeraceae bacterium]|nr:PRC-barrel domain-containing protein [Salinisphaeraceae bacterium]